MRSYTSGASYQFNATSNNIPLNSYVQVASQSPGYPSGKLMFYNSTGQIVVLGYGAQGSEQVIVTLPPTSGLPVIIELIFPNNTRISLKAIDAPATSGFVTLDFFI